jgi:hypothetical protein
MIPVWTYWEGTATLPDLVRECVASWHRHLDPAQYDVRFLQRHDLPQYHLVLPPTFDSLQHAAVRADIVRANLLAIYGGVWMDASTYLTESLDWLETYADRTLFAVRLPVHDHPENSFLYVPGTSSYVMTMWRDVLVDIVSAARVDDHPAHGASKTVTTDSYFHMYDAWVWLETTDPTFSKLAADGAYDRRAVLWNPAMPLDSHQRFVKFTAGGRRAYPCVRFPLVYVWFTLLVFVIAGIVIGVRRATA